MEKVLGDDSVLLPGVINGRPPDQGVLIPVPTKLERVALPISEEDQKVVKRSRGEGDEVMDVSEDGISRKARKASRGMNVDDFVAVSSQKTIVGTVKFDVLSHLATDVDGVEGTVDSPTLGVIVSEVNTHSLGPDVPE
ncbi:hypothetical protein V6N11_057912 [Hibiscus sabdariffa]|uniref:Uncharacterized protein n=1 Tax=Hibiscus sabdariffa TaxID=183260 RepID=A0ABR2P3X5_9ROSI